MSFVDIDLSDSPDQRAFQETLELLDWPIVCQHLSTFASTVQGRQECCNLQLPSDLESSRRQLAQTLELRALDQLLEGGISFKGAHDIRPILKLCSKGGMATGEQLLQVADTLAAARRLRRQVHDPDLRPVTSALLSEFTTLPELEKSLKFGLEEGGRIADRASSTLAELRRKRKSMVADRRERLQELLQRFSSILQDSVIAERNARPVLPLKAGSFDQLPGLVHDSSASGNTVFLEPQIVIPLGNRIAAIESQIMQEQNKLLTVWSLEVASYHLPLECLGNVILQLDLALARARYGHWLGGVPPTFQEEPDAPFIFNNLRHPLLVWQQRRDSGDEVVPITLEVSNHLRVVAITGPNTGGKTVTLKTIGLATLMARAGLLLPCVGSPSLPWCEQVLADIGDEQSLQQNLSTFSSHITRIRRILEAISSHPGSALVLLDEVGAGTDPTEGTALATSLLKVLADRARLTIATTHFGELKALKYTDSRFENASVGFDSETIKPTYHLQWGIPGRSNALAIARRLGLDSLVIQGAQQLIQPSGLDQADNVIQGLEEQRRRQQTAAEDAAALLARTELLHEELLSRWEKGRRQSEEIKELARQELELSIRDGQKEVRRLIRRLRDESANGETARRTGQKLRRMENDYRSEPSRSAQQGWFPKVGDRVRLIALGKAGEVLGISEDQLRLTILCGVFRSTVAISEVESLDGCKPSEPRSSFKVQVHATKGSGARLRTSENTVDVRGLRVHEAEAVVEEHMRNTSGPLWVIHGIGTGKLKHGLRKWLQFLPYVERVVDADLHDGGAGCSVVWLR